MSTVIRGLQWSRPRSQLSYALFFELSILTRNVEHLCTKHITNVSTIATTWLDSQTCGAAAGYKGVCAGHGTKLWRCKSSCQVFAEPKARRRARALSWGWVWTKSNPNLRDDVQKLDLRCDVFEASGHVTIKPSICNGVRFINPTSTQWKFSVLPRELCILFMERTETKEIRFDRCTEVSKRHSR